MKLSYSYIAFFIFLIFNFFDFVFYSLSNRFGIYVPVGFAGVLMSFLLLAKVVVFNSKDKLKFSLLALFFLLPSLILILSRYSEVKDIYLWFKMASSYAFGLFFARYLLAYGSKDKTFLFFIFVVSVFFLLFLIADYSVEEHENYLRIAISFSFLSILLLSFVKRVYHQILIFIVSVVCLYSIGSRFALLSYVFCFVFMNLYFSKNIKLFMWFCFLSVLLFVVYKFALSAYLELESIHSNRFLRLVFERENDTSLNSRNYLSEWAWEVFKKNVWFGEYKYYRAIESEGSYAHNFISYWAELGVLGMLMSAFIFVINIRALLSLRADFRGPNRVFVKFLTMAILVQMLGFLFAKYYGWGITYFVTGMSFFYLSLRKYENNLPSPTSARS